MRPLPAQEGFWTSPLHKELAAFLSLARSEAVIVAPFVTRRALERLVSRLGEARATVVTTWNVEDVLCGASDPAIYPYLCSRGWQLRIHPQLHAKLLVVDWRWAVIATANVTLRGLGLAEPSNVECALPVTCTAADRRWVFELLSSSCPVDDDIYNGFRARVAAAECAPPAGHIVASAFPDPQYLELPLTRSPRDLLLALEGIHVGNFALMAPGTAQAALHDARLFSLDVSAPSEENRAILRNRFFLLPLLKNLHTFAGRERFFGEVKAWLRRQYGKHVPAREVLTVRTQILFTWVAELGSGQYTVTRPRYSQCIVPLGRHSRDADAPARECRDQWVARSSD